MASRQSRAAEQAKAARQAKRRAEREAAEEERFLAEQKVIRRRLAFIIAGAVATAIVITLIFVSTIEGNREAEERGDSGIPTSTSTPTPTDTSR